MLGSLLDPVRARNARALANDTATDKTGLEAASARYEEWSAQMASTRETAGKAKAELQRRGHAQALAETPESHGTLDELQARANDAAARIAAQQAQRDASNQYTARMGREAQAEPEVGWRAEASDEIEMEPQ